MPPLHSIGVHLNIYIIGINRSIDIEGKNEVLKVLDFPDFFETSTFCGKTSAKWQNGRNLHKCTRTTQNWADI